MHTTTAKNRHHAADLDWQRTARGRYENFDGWKIAKQDGGWIITRPGAELEQLPACPRGHGRMRFSRYDWMGTWYVCPSGPPGDTCESAALLCSPALDDFLASQRHRAAREEEA